MSATNYLSTQIPIPHGLLFVFPAAVALLLFTGLESWLLFLATALLLLWLFINLSRVPTRTWLRRITGGHLLLLLFWLWLAFTVLWSRAPAESLFRLWPATLFIPVIWAYLLEPDPKRLWRTLCFIVAIIATVLAIISYFQVFILDEPARSVFVTRNSHAGFMNLVLLPVVAYAVRSHIAGSRTSRWFQLGMATLIILLAFSIALSASRAGALCLAGGLGIVLAISARRRLLKPALAWTGLVAVTYAIAQQMVNSGSGALVDRSLLVVHDRLIIWTQAWEMLKDAPWFGIGLGTYAFAWPPYKHPSDPSSGFFVHNDYLQLWIETGIPGLAILVIVGLFFLMSYWNATKSKKCDKASDMEMIGLIAAICSTAAHSFVDFNFHIPVTMLGLGLVMGQFLRISAPLMKSNRSLSPPNIVKQGARFGAMTTLVLALIYVVTYGLGDVFAKIGMQRAKQGELAVALSYFRTAAVFGRANDRVLSGYADFLRQLLLQMPDTTDVQKKELYQNSRQLLDNVEDLNPLRWDSALIRARLYKDNQKFSGDERLDTVARAYRHALALNPWFYEARVELATLLLNAGDPHSAAEVLWFGIHYAYPQTFNLLKYYILAFAVHDRWGSREQSEVIRAKLVDLEESLKNRGPVKNCPLPARLWRTC